MADGGGLENRFGGDPDVGSNPTPSALEQREDPSDQRKPDHRGPSIMTFPVPLGLTGHLFRLTRCGKCVAKLPGPLGNLSRWRRRQWAV